MQIGTLKTNDRRHRNLASLFSVGQIFVPERVCSRDELLDVKSGYIFNLVTEKLYDINKNIKTADTPTMKELKDAWENKFFIAK